MVAELKGTHGDYTTATEIYLVAKNSSDWYKRIREPLERAITKAIMHGKYSPQKAENAFYKRLQTFVKSEEFKMVESHDFKPKPLHLRMAARTFRRDIEHETKIEMGT